MDILITPLFVTGLKLTVAVYDLFKYERPEMQQMKINQGNKMGHCFCFIRCCICPPLLNTYIPLT